MANYEKIGTTEDGIPVVRLATKQIPIKKHRELSEELLKNLSEFIFSGIYIKRESSQARGILFIIGKMKGKIYGFVKEELDLIGNFCEKHNLTYELLNESKLIIRLK